MKRGILASLAIGVCVSVAMAPPSVAMETEQPAKQVQKSEFVIDHSDWDQFLRAMVLDVGPSSRRQEKRVRVKSTESKLQRGAVTPKSYEANRVLFHAFTPEHLAFLTSVRDELAAVPGHMPLEKFSKDEQLAYWLNLHNVAVTIEIANAYPVRKLKKIASGKKSVWHKKTMTVAGEPMSIKDIEDHVINGWDNPLVLYGFFMGAVGGPNMRDQAYTGADVWQALEANARDFVNSLRGFTLWMNQGRISDHYKLGARFFPGEEEDIKAHMLAYAKKNTRRDIEKAKVLKLKNYDWDLAGLKKDDRWRARDLADGVEAFAGFMAAKSGTASENAQFGSPIVKSTAEE